MIEPFWTGVEYRTFRRLHHSCDEVSERYTGTTVLLLYRQAGPRARGPISLPAGFDDARNLALKSEAPEAKTADPELA
jgi:hypothetical protein